jgi:hypothetical protein
MFSLCFFFSPMAWLTVHEMFLFKVPEYMGKLTSEKVPRRNRCPPV